LTVGLEVTDELKLSITEAQKHRRCNGLNICGHVCFFKNTFKVNIIYRSTLVCKPYSVFTCQIFITFGAIISRFQFEYRIFLKFFISFPSSLVSAEVPMIFPFSRNFVSYLSRFYKNINTIGLFL